MRASPTRFITKFMVAAALSAIGVAGLGCYPKAGPAPGALSANSVAWASTKWPGATAASLSAGREAFLAKCNGCHAYPDRDAIADDEWPSIVERMGKKSGLDDSTREAVLHFVLASKHP